MCSCGVSWLMSHVSCAGPRQRRPEIQKPPGIACHDGLSISTSPRTVSCAVGTGECDDGAYISTSLRECSRGNQPAADVRRGDVNGRIVSQTPRRTTVNAETAELAEANLLSAGSGGSALYVWGRRSTQKPQNSLRRIFSLRVPRVPRCTPGDDDQRR